MHLLDNIIRRAAAQAHQLDCACDETHCKGPSPDELLIAGVTIKAALPDLFLYLTDQVTTVVSSMESGHFATGDPDATDITSDELLRLWFHTWRVTNDQLPGDLHVRTVAYLASRAVQRGEQLRTAADV